MERIKQMEIKKALFTIAFIDIAIAFGLSLFITWICVELRSQIAPVGEISMDVYSADSVVINRPRELAAQAVRTDRIISFAQILLPFLTYVLALLAIAVMFYRLKLKEPLEVLKKGAARMIDNDLDFTIETKSQDELGQLCTAFETMRKTLLENNSVLWRQAEERKRLNAAFSHNLRNPVTVLKGSVKLARKSIENTAEPSGQLMDHLQRMESYTDRIAQYIETMSSIQKLEDIDVQRELIKWDSLMGRLNNMICFAGKDAQKQIRFNAVEYAGDVLVDPSVLFQITENLLSNALRFAADSIDIFCSVTDGKLQLSITDDGCGFPGRLVKKGIQPFQKGNEDMEHFGIGLYTCKILCNRHGGSIAVKNNQAGAVVSVTLGAAMK